MPIVKFKPVTLRSEAKHSTTALLASQFMEFIVINLRYFIRNMNIFKQAVKYERH